MMVRKGENGETNEFSKYCRGVQVPSEDEVVALNAMRNIKGRVRELKKRLSLLSSSGRDEHVEEIAALDKEMNRLKAEWNGWEERRKNAASERMILLGHEDGPE